MRFWTNLGNAWSDYQNNFVAILLLMGIFIFIPSVVYSYLNDVVFSAAAFDWTSALVLVPVFIIYLLMSSFAYISLTLASLKRTRFSLRQASALGRSVYWNALGFSIVLCLFLVGLFILLIVPGVIFFVYWTFAIYVFLENGKKGIFYALGESKRLVKGRWWRTFGNVLLLIVLALVVFGIGSVFYLVSDFVGGLIYQAINALFVTPLAVLFIKHLYLEYKKKR